MKIRITILLLLLTVIMSCNDNPVYNDNYYSNIITEFYTLHPGNWKVVPETSIQWYQDFALPTTKINNFDFAGVMVYYLNQYDAWEALPSTRIFWTDKDVVYSDELWFSNNLDYLFIDYRNTIPGIASPPKDIMKIKAVYFDNNFQRSKAFKDIDWNNYEDVSSKLNLKD